MAATPNFGGTNGVTELNIGQKGSTFEQGGVALYEAIEQGFDDEISNVVSRVPQGSMSFVETMGWTSSIVVWTGKLWTTNDALMSTIESLVSLLSTGQTVSIAGVRGAMDVTQRVGTQLVNGDGRTISENAIMMPPVWGKRGTLAGTDFAFSVDLTLRFRKLK